MMTNMDCNKDEAARAKALAKRKLLDKDFVGAKELIIKAQELSKEVGDIDMQKMLTVCDVHCAAGAEENGQIDWYGILQVPETADDAHIKKQYRKLSLLLHPDKNKFGGAEAAFKLVGEANKTLTDRSKRYLYDMERVVRATQTSFWTICPYCKTRYEYPISALEKVVRCWNRYCLKHFIAYERVVVESNISETSSDNEEGMVESSECTISEISSDNEEERVMVEFSESSISKTSSDSKEEIAEKEGIPDKSLELDLAALSLVMAEDIPSISGAQVVSIMHDSAGHDLMEHALPSGANQQYVGVWKNAGVSQKSLGPQTNVTAHKAWSAALELNLNVASHHAGENTKKETDANTAGPQDKLRSGHAARNPSKASSTAGLKRVKYDEEIDDDNDVLNSKVDDSVNSPGLKRLRKSSIFHGDHSIATNLNQEIAGHNGLTNGVYISSNTQKNKVSAPASCGEKSFNKIQQMERETMHGGENGDGKEKEFHSGRSNGLGHSTKFQYEVVQVLSDLTMSTSINVMPLVKIKGYDNLFVQSREAAPYVIPQVDTLSFSHCIPHHVMSAIGERVPEGSLELDPAALPLPIDLEKAFSSVIPECSLERSQERDARYARSSSDNGCHEGSMSVGNRQHTTCMNAAIAAKTPKEVDIEHNTTTASDDKFTFLDPEFLDFEQLRNEKGVPKVSVELDPAALPPDMVDTFPCEIPECCSVSQDCGAKYSGLSSGSIYCKGSMNVGEGQDTTCMNAGIASETPKEESWKQNTCSAEVTDVDEDSICGTVYIRAESDFYDFSQSRLLQKISPGKIWALYSDVDNFPNYYGFIQKADLKNGKIQIRWLDVCPRGDEEKRLLQEERTIGCGTFRLSRVHKLAICTETIAFSHCVVARSTGQKGEYEIFPNLGEIWAVYKNWRVGWTAQDFRRCEYELVEILDHTSSSIRVHLLRKVDGYNMVFMPYQAKGSAKTIRQDEYPKFSHQIPCFRLTCEGGGKLQGCLELDPLSLPEEFLNVR